MLVRLQIEYIHKYSTLNVCNLIRIESLLLMRCIDIGWGLISSERGAGVLEDCQAPYSRERQSEVRSNR